MLHNCGLADHQRRLLAVHDLHLRLEGVESTRIAPTPAHGAEKKNKAVLPWPLWLCPPSRLASGHDVRATQGIPGG